MYTTKVAWVYYKNFAEAEININKLTKLKYGKRNQEKRKSYC